MAVWPRFKGAVEGQVQSLKTAGTSSASVPSGAWPRVLVLSPNRSLGEGMADVAALCFCAVS
eukprot:1171108-Rhodomonas_salina.1